jgi:pentatricopeptide repeat protein
VFDQLLRRRVSFNAYTYNCLLQLCASAGRMDDALAVYNLQRLETEPANLPDAYTYNALMRGVLVAGCVELTQQVRGSGVLLDAVLALPSLHMRVMGCLLLCRMHFTAAVRLPACLGLCWL